MRNFFDLQKAQFSDSSEQDIQILSKQALNMYNQEYSLLLLQTKKFFAQCKDCISRLMALNNVGFGFNLPFVLTSLIAIENKPTYKKNKRCQQLQSEHQKKQKYFQSFYDVLFRMSQVIDDLQNIEFEIKTNYLGMKVGKPIKKRRRRQSFFDQKASDKSHQRSNNQISKNIKKSIIEQEEINNIQNEQKIRDILNKNMAISSITKSNIVSVQLQPLTNLQKLGDKMDMITKKMKDQRRKQQKFWENFKDKIINVQRQKFLTQEKIVKASFLENTIKTEQNGDISVKTKNSMGKDSFTFYQ